MLKYLKTSYLKVSGVFVLFFFPDLYPSLGVAVDCIPAGTSVGEDPSLGVTDGGLLGRGLPSQGNLVDVEVDVEREVIIGGGT